MKKPLLSELTLEEKIGQMLLGYQYHINRKSEVDAKIFRTDEEKAEYLKNEKFGSLYAQTGDYKNIANVNAYGKSPELMKAFVEGIYGEIPFVGESPVNLIPEARRW